MPLFDPNYNTLFWRDEFPHMDFKNSEDVLLLLQRNVREIKENLDNPASPPILQTPTSEEIKDAFFTPLVECNQQTGLQLIISKLLEADNLNVILDTIYDSIVFPLLQSNEMDQVPWNKINDYFIEIFICNSDSHQQNVVLQILFEQNPSFIIRQRKLFFSFPEFTKRIILPWLDKFSVESNISDDFLSCLITIGLKNPGSMFSDETALTTYSPLDSSEKTNPTKSLSNIEIVLEKLFEKKPVFFIKDVSAAFLLFNFNRENINKFPWNAMTDRDIDNFVEYIRKKAPQYDYLKKHILQKLVENSTDYCIANEEKLLLLGTEAEITLSFFLISNSKYIDIFPWDKTPEHFIDQMIMNIFINFSQYGRLLKKIIEKIIERCPDYYEKNFSPQTSFSLNKYLTFSEPMREVLFKPSLYFVLKNFIPIILFVRTYPALDFTALKKLSSVFKPYHRLLNFPWETIDNNTIHAILDYAKEVQNEDLEVAVFKGVLFHNLSFLKDSIYKEIVDLLSIISEEASATDNQINVRRFLECLNHSNLSSKLNSALLEQLSQKIVLTNFLSSIHWGLLENYFIDDVFSFAEHSQNIVLKEELALKIFEDNPYYFVGQLDIFLSLSIEIISENIDSILSLVKTDFDDNENQSKKLYQLLTFFLEHNHTPFSELIDETVIEIFNKLSKEKHTSEYNNDFLKQIPIAIIARNTSKAIDQITCNNFNVEDKKTRLNELYEVLKSCDQELIKSEINRIQAILETLSSPSQNLSNDIKQHCSWVVSSLISGQISLSEFTQILKGSILPACQNNSDAAYNFLEMLEKAFETQKPARNIEIELSEENDTCVLLAEIANIALQTRTKMTLTLSWVKKLQQYSDEFSDTLILSIPKAPSSREASLSGETNNFSCEEQRSLDDLTMYGDSSPSVSRSSRLSSRSLKFTETPHSPRSIDSALTPTIIDTDPWEMKKRKLSNYLLSIRNATSKFSLSISDVCKLLEASHLKAKEAQELLQIFHQELSFLPTPQKLSYSPRHFSAEDESIKKAAKKQVVAQIQEINTKIDKVLENFRENQKLCEVLAILISVSGNQFDPSDPNKKCSNDGLFTRFYSNSKRASFRKNLTQSIRQDFIATHARLNAKKYPVAAAFRGFMSPRTSISTEINSEKKMSGVFENPKYKR